MDIATKQVAAKPSYGTTGRLTGGYLIAGLIVGVVVFSLRHADDGSRLLNPYSHQDQIRSALPPSPLQNILAQIQSVFDSLEYWSYDRRMRLRPQFGSTRIDDRIVIVEIEDQSLKEVGRWPWDRSTVGSMLDTIESLGTKATFLDIKFPEPTRNEASNPSDAVLTAALENLDLNEISRSGETWIIPRKNGSPGGAFTLPADESGRILIDFMGPWHRDGFARITASEILRLGSLRKKHQEWLGEYPEIARTDGLLHGLGLSHRWLQTLASGDLYLGRPLSPVTAHDLDRDRDSIRSERERACERIDEKLRKDMTRILKGMGQALQQGRTETVDRAQVYLEQISPTYRTFAVELPNLERILGAKLKGKAALIGLTASTTTDLSVTPVDRSYVNLGVHANVLNQMLTHSPLRPANSWGEEMLGVLFFLLLVPLAVAWTPMMLSPLITVLGGFAYSAYATWSMIAIGRWVPMAAPLVTCASTFVFSMAIRYFREERQKNRIRMMFSSYVDEKIVDLLVEDEGSWSELGGCTRDITPFFSELADFSTISELFDPDELSTMLVDYLTPMSRIVLAHGGVRERFVGDAIVAFFGAPVPQEDHAIRGCLAAIEQRERLAQLKNEWVTDRHGWYLKLLESGLDLEFRIGLTSGQAKVGNFGSSDVKNYTINGDIVNLASRLEALNKIYGTRILIAGRTFLAAQGLGITCERNSIRRSRR